MINIWMSYLHVCTYSCFVQWVYIVFLQSCALRIPIIAPVRGQQTNKHKHLTSAIGHHHDHPIMRHLLHILDNRPEPRLLDCKSLMIANVFSRNATIFYSVYSCVSGWTSDAFQLQAVGDIDSHLSQETNALVLSEAWLLQISLAMLGLHHWVWHLEYKNSLFEDVLPQVIALFFITQTLFEHRRRSPSFHHLKRKIWMHMDKLHGPQASTFRAMALWHLRRRLDEKLRKILASKDLAEVARSCSLLASFYSLWIVFFWWPPSKIYH